MASIWVEPYRNQPIPFEYTPQRAPAKILMVSVASFTFRFISVQQIEDCLAYYQAKTHATSSTTA